MEQTVKGGKIAIVDRIWKRNDKIELYLPMEVFTSTWYKTQYLLKEVRWYMP